MSMLAGPARDHGALMDAIYRRQVRIYDITRKYYLFGRDRLNRLAIPGEAFAMDGVEFHGKISFLKAGIYYASQITTVSATYAREITTPEFGCGLDGLLRARSGQGRLTGILNVIDESWDPRTDPHLPHPFDSANWRGKEANAHHLREGFGLAVGRGPLFAVVSRLVHQKGLDLTIAAIESIVRDGGQLVVTGEGEPEVENALRATAARHPESIAVKIGYEEPTARRIFAGSDFLLMPSRFEPCGLSQMYAQRFGSLPIAHNTGGLGDTIEDGATGFLFNGPTAETFAQAINRAKSVFDRKDHLDAMRRRAMRRPFGWKESVRSYMDVYRRALGLDIAAVEATPGLIRVVTATGRNLTLKEGGETLNQELESWRRERDGVGHA